MDALTEEAEIRVAIGCELSDANEQAESIAVVRTFLYPWQERAAVVRMPTEIATQLLAKGRIRIGWTMARLTPSAPRNTLRRRQQVEENADEPGDNTDTGLAGGSAIRPQPQATV